MVSGKIMTQSLRHKTSAEVPTPSGEAGGTQLAVLRNQ